MSMHARAALISLVLVVAALPDPAAAHEPVPLTPVQEAYWLGRQNLVALGQVVCHAYSEFQLAALDVELRVGVHARDRRLDLSWIL
jgi:hypothetical protein